MWNAEPIALWSTCFTPDGCAVLRYVRPSFVEANQPPRLNIVQGRHPVLDVALESTVVPNDTHLAAGGPRALVITGPNMGGKSCYMRSAALIAIMAQVDKSTPPTPCEKRLELDALTSKPHSIQTHSPRQLSCRLALTPVDFKIIEWH